MKDKYTEELLKQQVLDIMEEDKNPQKKKPKKGKKKKHRFLKGMGIALLVMLALLLFFVGTKPGRTLLYKVASKFVYNNVQHNLPGDNDDKQAKGKRKPSDDVVSEDYVYNYLIFGIEEIGGARNTDAMLIGSINTKDGKLKLTSLLRDSYVDIPGYKANKLNSAYSRGGVKLLIETIEKNYKIHIDGYASVNFDAFEKIVDLLGGVEIELGKEEANYLNRTNYISKKSNRNVVPGLNKMNGNQVMGYVRVRKVKTLGSANFDYGRVVRQQRALAAMFDSLMSRGNILKIIPISTQALSYLTTDLEQKQIEKMMEAVIENKMTKLETFRVPVDGAFEAPKKYNGIGYPIVLDWETNRLELYKFIFGYTQEEAVEALAKVNK
ncbi:MAG: LytR family transcriptional regulator [Clostridiales bacterium]|jgi:LCP family protein required for cell wall assembly|nr:LytR family transcriptional regulator [Clostridiales bacterium]